MSDGVSHLVSLLLIPGERAGLAFPFSAYPVLLLCNLGGLKNVVLALAFGYGLSMFAGGFITFYQAPTTAWSQTACGLYMAHGVRLALFIMRRWFQEAYNNSDAGSDTVKKTSAFKLSSNAAATVFVSLTHMATMCALQPAAFAETYSPGAWAGLAIAGFGLVLETIADEEKNSAKQTKPNEPIMTGTYKLVKHPNYLGELLFWFGIAVASEVALPPSASIGQRFGACFGALLMISVMVGASKELSKTSSERYEKNTDYLLYAAKTKSLIPGIF